MTDDFRRHQWDPSDFIQPPEEHGIDDERSASGEMDYGDEDYPFSGLIEEAPPCDLR